MYRWRIWTLPGWSGVGYLNMNCQVFQQNTCALSFNMEVFKAKEFTLQADGSEEKSYKKVMVTDLALYKKLTFKSSSWVGHLNAILVHGGRNWNEPIFKSLNVLVVVTYFSYYRRNARGNHCNNKKLTLKRLFPVFSASANDSSGQVQPVNSSVDAGIYFVSCVLNSEQLWHINWRQIQLPKFNCGSLLHNPCVQAWPWVLIF